MESPQGVDIDPTAKQIIMALLVHPRLARLRGLFRAELSTLLARPDTLAKVARTGEIRRDELEAQGQRLATLLSAADPPAAIVDYADVAIACCLSAGFLTFWGQFTSALARLMSDDTLLSDVARSFGTREQVRGAIRQFSDPRRMRVGCAGL